MLRGYAILDGPELARPVLALSRTRHAISEVTVHDLATGERLGTLSFPASAASAASPSGPRAGTRRGSATPTTRRPPVVLRYDAATGALET